MGITQKAAWARRQLPRGSKPGLPSLAYFSVVTVALTQHLAPCTLIQALTLTDTCNRCPDPQGGYPELCQSVLRIFGGHISACVIAGVCKFKCQQGPVGPSITD